MSWMHLPLSREKRSYYYGSGGGDYYFMLPPNYTNGIEYMDYPTIVDIEDETDNSEANDLFNGFISADTAPVLNHTRTLPVRTLCLVDENGNLQRDVYFSDVTCDPLPDEFNPCENVLGTTVLPVVSWTVSCLAIVGNLFVIIVLSVVSCDKTSANHHHLSVSKFLVLNLALADLCMGTYLLMLSLMDAITAGEYYKFGAIWQTGAGCNIAGFLAILSSQLSIYILCVISIERWYAIHFAIHLDKRMTMRCARILVLIGWLISIALALLPVFGVNNYHKASICLPMDTRTTTGIVYVAVLLLASIASFLVVVTCYLWMYTTVRTVNDSGRDGMFRRKRRSSTSSSKNNGGSPLSSTVDATIAKRMAVLVFTNFACFFPISFFVLTAAVGHPLISISNSKILLVIFFPLNSCCNPFLYAILTKSFRRDLLTWLTSRGYCVRFASKRHGAQWRRQSTNCGKKETYMRRKIQQCVKYVVRYKAVSIEHDTKENNNVKQINHDDNSTKTKCAQTSMPPDQHGLVPPCSDSKLDKSSSDSYGCENISIYPPLELTKRRPKFRLPFFQRPGRKSLYKCNDAKETGAKKSLLKSGRCWSTRDNDKDLKIHEEHDDDEIRERMFASDTKMSKRYKNRFNKPRHSTSTIETRLTVNHSHKNNEHDN